MAGTDCQGLTCHNSRTLSARCLMLHQVSLLPWARSLDWEDPLPEMTSQELESQHTFPKTHDNSSENVRFSWANSMSDPNVAFAFPFPSLEANPSGGSCKGFSLPNSLCWWSGQVCKLAQATDKSQEMLGMDVTPLRVKKRVRICPYWSNLC